MSKSIAVMGIGRFGKKVAVGLSELGVDVMAVDGNREILESISNVVTYAIQADLTNADAIKGLGLEGMDAVVVAMGEDMTASIMCIMVAKEVGVPYVIAKAAEERRGIILKKVGADKVIFPEEETGLKVARLLASDNFVELFDIDDNLCILEMRPKKEWVGKNMIDLDLRGKYGINVVAVKDENEKRSFIDPHRPIEDDTYLLVVAEKSDLDKLK